ncbi:hypothetical protein AGMMS49573_10900 [Endomicrobiia bacterium]|nr:hypothetical protein AGMMS49573_10900 [Endomicrobiia bacterium]
MKTLIFDQAKSCGWAVFEGDNLIEYGIEKLGNDKTAYENVLLPAVEFARRLMEKTKIDRVIIEGIQYQSNLSVYRKLALLQGALICLFSENRIPYSVVEPAKWKSFCKIKGAKRAEQKENAIRFVKEKYGFDVSSDEADAICMGVWSLGNTENLYEGYE